MTLRQIVLPLAGAFLLGACTHTAQTPTPEPAPVSQEMPAQDATGTAEMTADTQLAEVEKYTLAEVATHNTPPDDCWIVLAGKVYDVSGFAEAGHGGGEAVYQGCGIDATQLYETRPMGSGTPHSDTARGFLPNFYIGDLAE